VGGLSSEAGSVEREAPGLKLNAGNEARPAISGPSDESGNKRPGTSIADIGRRVRVRPATGDGAAIGVEGGPSGRAGKLKTGFGGGPP
jgi:hypothetical protein